MYNVYTTFSPKDYALYGKNCIKTFIDFWPDDMKLYVYYEAKPEVLHDKIIWLDYYSECPDQKIFSEKARRYPQDNFYKAATRFSYKAFTIINHLEKNLGRYNIWLDADCIAVKKIDYSWLCKLHTEDTCVSTLLRKSRAAESGFILTDSSHEQFDLFLKKYAECYRKLKLFNLPEWHDGYILSNIINQYKIKTFNLSPTENRRREQHPFAVGILGEYLDHLKGPRKHQGFSNERLEVWK